MVNAAAPPEPHMRLPSESQQTQLWDDGRVRMSRDFAGLFQHAKLTTFDSIMHHAGTVAKNLRADRVTSRFTLTDASGEERAFYIKRHRRSSLWETLKPLLRLTWPMLGARPEWTALWKFHAAGIPTMIPVAIGEQGAESFLITAAIDGCVKLSEWVPALVSQRQVAAKSQSARETLRRLIESTARVAQRMHQSGLHHQDFYLGHLLHPVIGVSESADLVREPIVIDLGRARKVTRLARRWIVKDLAQLNYSARMLTRTDRLRFLLLYLDRRLQPADRSLLRAILRKSQHIATHSRKHRFM